MTKKCKDIGYWKTGINTIIHIEDSNKTNVCYGLVHKIYLIFFALYTV